MNHQRDFKLKKCCFEFHNTDVNDTNSNDNKKIRDTLILASWLLSSSAFRIQCTDPQENDWIGRLSATHKINFITFIKTRWPLQLDLHHTDAGWLVSWYRLCCTSGGSVRAAAESTWRLCEWKSRRHGSGACWSDGVHSLKAKQQ